MNESNKKTMQLYLPNSAKFSNKLLLKRLGTATPNTITFDDKTIERCHHMAFRRDSLRYHPNNRMIDFGKPLSSRVYCSLKKSSHSTTLSRSEGKKISFSRMIQESNKSKDFKFSYIAQYFKKPIEKELQAKREKKDKSQINEILNIVNYKSSEKEKPKIRINKTSENKCRCQKNPNRQVYSSLSPRRDETTVARGEAREKKGKRRTIALNVPENWTVESWNYVPTKVSDRDVFEKEES